MPRKLVGVGIEKVEWQDFAEPPLSAGQVRVKPRFGAAKHGTELAHFKGYAFGRGGFDRQAGGIFNYQRPEKIGEYMVGNMQVGPVVEVGPGVTRFKAGDRVLCYGGFAQSLAVSERDCWALPESAPWQSAVCLDPADFAFSAVRDGHIRIGDAAAIFGLGAIGLMAVQLAKLAGASPIIAVDPLPARRALAGKLGADVVLDPSACDAGAEIKQATALRGADVCIEYSGSWRAMQAALRGVAYAGTVVAGAWPAPYPEGLDFGAEAHLNIPRIVFSRACSQPDRDHPRWDNARIFENCLRLILGGQLRGQEIVRPIVKFDQLKDAYPKTASEPDAYIKLGVEY